ncbi:hypothetical protein TraAM80_07959 [Trypanosoma rangeli]|uniref:Uncharacterized protein n=1 Tax=Trypanosoma rangeli TaxID=5698 RepID=A0A422N344_TRYRA|nr:uncharacterized protein TraAM80_07959 [Trypanosoma rangeli]RNE99839.1 hypothetical protein TraAM80_07959 [Trypanosoma rangeli]|eukprot:RNE99839.1 hypothetical protein TraAM80_07959 [Trypanosoma rangeli]
MSDTGLVIAMIFGTLGGLAIIVWGGLFLFYRYKLFEPTFSMNGEELRGIPLRSLAPRMTEERRLNLRLAQRQLQLNAQRQEREATDVRGENDNSVSGGDNSTPSVRTHGRNSRWFRRRPSADSLTSTTLASSSVVYGRGDYLSHESTLAPPSPRSQTEAGESYRSGELSSSTMQLPLRERRFKLRHRFEDNARNGPFGGWTDSARSCNSNEDGEEINRSVEVGVVSPSLEGQRPTRRHIIEQNAAMSGFFTAPANGWNHAPYAEDCTIPERMNI